MPVQSVLDFAHTVATAALPAGGTAIDATVGNGHDTVVLARAVGADGRVFGFDVQAEAIAETRRRLSAEDLAGRAELWQAGHEAMDEHVPASLHGAIDAVMFNLGYLPGSDSSLTTTPTTTLPALDATLRFLRPGGVVTIVLYTGHEGGSEEAAAVEAWASDLEQERFRALSYRFLNQRHDPPRLVAVERRATADDGD